MNESIEKKKIPSERYFRGHSGKSNIVRWSKLCFTSLQKELKLNHRSLINHLVSFGLIHLDYRLVASKKPKCFLWISKQSGFKLVQQQVALCCTLRGAAAGKQWGREVEHDAVDIVPLLQRKTTLWQKLHCTLHMTLTGVRGYEILQLCSKSTCPDELIMIGVHLSRPIPGNTFWNDCDRL